MNRADRRRAAKTARSAPSVYPGSVTPLSDYVPGDALPCPYGCGPCLPDGDLFYVCGCGWSGGVLTSPDPR